MHLIKNNNSCVHHCTVASRIIKRGRDQVALFAQQSTGGFLLKNLVHKYVSVQLLLGIQYAAAIFHFTCSKWISDTFTSNHGSSFCDWNSFSYITLPGLVLDQKGSGNTCNKYSMWNQLDNCCPAYKPSSRPVGALKQLRWGLLSFENQLELCWRLTRTGRNLKTELMASCLHFQDRRVHKIVSSF